MKKLAVVVVLLFAGWIAYQYSGSGGGSPEAKELQALWDRLGDAESQLAAAGRAAGVAGIDTTADATAALEEVRRIESDLDALRGRLSGADAEEVDRLAEAIRQFRSGLR
jgi:hypothetical protein